MKAKNENSFRALHFQVADTREAVLPEMAELLQKDHNGTADHENMKDEVQ
jgi:hypothetical protein